MGDVLALIVVVTVMGAVKLIVSGARRHRAAPPAHEHAGVGRMVIGIAMLGLVLGGVWLFCQAVGKLALR